LQRHRKIAATVQIFRRKPATEENSHADTRQKKSVGLNIEYKSRYGPSRMFTVADGALLFFVFFLPLVGNSYPAPGCKVMIAVSFFSFALSINALSVTLPEFRPAGIVN